MCVYVCKRETLGTAHSLLKSSAEATLKFTAKRHLLGEASCAVNMVNKLTERKYGAPIRSLVTVNFLKSSCRNRDNHIKAKNSSRLGDCGKLENRIS